MSPLHLLCIDAMSRLARRQPPVWSAHGRQAPHLRPRNGTEAPQTAPPATVAGSPALQPLDGAATGGDSHGLLGRSSLPAGGTSGPRESPGVVQTARPKGAVARRLSLLLHRCGGRHPPAPSP